jgi:hypothetical protein
MMFRGLYARKAFSVMQRFCLHAAVVTPLLLGVAAFFLIGGSLLHSQTPLESQKDRPEEGAQPPAQGGSITAGVFAPVLDENHRPITAGGTVKAGPVPFEDITVKAGLSAWRHQMGSPEKRYILETIGSGVALLDYDNDGWLDIYLVNGSTEPALNGKAPSPHAALFHNNHDGTFTDVTKQAGVADDRWGFGVAVGDYDNDGWPDIYVTNFGKNRLYHNNHDGTFTDVTEKAGVTLGSWSTGATWGDLNKGDGTFEDLSYSSGYALKQGGPRNRFDGDCRRRLPQQRAARHLQHNILR